MAHFLNDLIAKEAAFDSGVWTSDGNLSKIVCYVAKMMFIVISQAVSIWGLEMVFFYLIILNFLLLLHQTLVDK